MLALNVRPQAATGTPSSEPPASRRIFSIIRSCWTRFTSTTPSRRLKSYPARTAVWSSAAVSFGKQEPPYPGPGCRNSNPIRLS